MRSARGRSPHRRVSTAGGGAAVRAGGTDEGGPAERTYFAPGYYGANVADFDGNRLELVHKAWTRRTS